MSRATSTSMCGALQARGVGGILVARSGEKIELQKGTTYRNVNQAAIKISEGFALNGRLHLSIHGSLMSFPENASVTSKLCRFFGIHSSRFTRIRCRFSLMFSSFSMFFPAPSLSLSLSLPSFSRIFRTSFLFCE